MTSSEIKMLLRIFGPQMTLHDVPKMFQIGVKHFSISQSKVHLQKWLINFFIIFRSWFVLNSDLKNDLDENITMVIEYFWNDVGIIWSSTPINRERNFKLSN